MWMRIRDKTIDVIVYMSIKYLFELILDCNNSDTLQTLIESLFISIR